MRYEVLKGPEKQSRVSIKLGTRGRMTRQTVDSMNVFLRHEKQSTVWKAKGYYYDTLRAND